MTLYSLDVFARRLLLGSVVVAFAGCSVGERSDGVQELDVTLQNEFEIGVDTGDETLPLFEDVRSIVTDERGHIFVFEYRRGQFHEYTPDGAFVTTHGAQGRGPGEFQVITLTDITEEGELLIFDHHSRRLTFFDPVTAEFESVDFPTGSVGDLIDVEGRLVAFEFNPVDPASVREPVFAVYGENIDEPPGRFGRYDTFASDSSLVVRFMYSSGHFVEWSNGELLFAPRVHDGRIFRFEQTGDTWSYRDEVEASSVDPPYTLLDDPDDERADFQLHGFGGVWVADVAEYSQGLYRLSDGRLIHMVQREDDDGLYLGVDVFASDLQFIGTGRIETQVEGSEMPQILHMTPLWLDERDRLYLRRIQPKPSVEVASLMIAEPGEAN